MAKRKSPQQKPLEAVELDLQPNEASDLVPLENEKVLKAHGWKTAFWTVLDEEAVEKCVVAVGLAADRRGDDRAEPDDSATPESEEGGEPKWEIVRPRFAVPRNDRSTEDAEACTRHDGWVYVVGSHYGSKTGPLEKERQWVARFREDDFEGTLRDSRPKLEIAMNRFRLHRAVNDALRAFGPDLIELGPKVRKQLVKKTRKKAGKKAKARISPADLPINIEGASFTDERTLLIGLRFPVTAAGHPILAELSGVEEMFGDKLAAPVVRRFWVLSNVGSAGTPCGVRALHRSGRELHAVVGNLDDPSKDSVLIADHPAGGKARSAHYRFRLPRGRDGGEVEAELVRRFKAENVEGVARVGSRFHYVTDEDEKVRVRYPAG
ncbi:MAG TPA: hypothetical protein VGR10_01625 [Thermoleophilaceae bacterium]|nr:hypothetical protein [Thermoleophilaceae bacterium]